MLTVFNFFSPTAEQVVLAVGDTTKSRPLSPVKELESLKSDLVGKAFLDQVSQALDISLVGVLLRGWREYGQVKKALQDSRKSAESILVSLVKHTIDSDYDPFVTISRGRVPLVKISFAVSLEILIEGLILKVESGKVKEIKAGRFTASGTLQCEGVTLCEKKLQPLPIPGGFVIGPKEQADADEQIAEAETAEQTVHS